MKKRKLIGCILNCPENIYQSHILDGLMARCDKYGYDLAVFSPLVNATHFYKDYLHAEFNILELINFDLIDAVVVVSLPFIAMGDTSIFDNVYELLKCRCNKPVICLDMPMGDYETIYTDDTTPFSMITRHIFDVHKCKNVYFLAGSQTEGVEDKRLKGFVDECERRNIKVDDSKIFYGDFWYTSGAALAERIASGELEMPDAVICASDHMALGLANKLVQCGISVPDQVIVTGYDATQEAMVNELSITSFAPDNKGMAVQAIDRIRMILEPDKEMFVSSDDISDNLFIGHSCGCEVNYKRLISLLTTSLYRVNRDCANDNIKGSEDLCNLMESYMLEALTESKSPEECLGQICSRTYLISPFDHFYLCLHRNWLDTDTPLIHGYPATMRTNVVSIPYERHDEEGAVYYHCDDDRAAFNTKLMLPELFEEHEKPQVFYFFPVHFQKNTLGYSVLQADADQGVKPTNVVRNWMRNVNNALEMTRVNNRLVDFSEIDKLTGLKNRRGMESGIKELFAAANEKSYCYAIVFDLDGLKHINDNYGHSEGDYAIKSIAAAVAKIADEKHEVAVRAGGDEFYLIGIDEHITEKTLIAKVSTYRSIVDEFNHASNKPYEMSASVGFSLRMLVTMDDIDKAINSADKHMYLCKAESKRGRR